MILVEPHSVSLVAVISRRIRTHGTGGSLLTGQLCEIFHCRGDISGCTARPASSRCVTACQRSKDKSRSCCRSRQRGPEARPAAGSLRQAAGSAPRCRDRVCSLHALPRHMLRGGDQGNLAATGKAHRRRSRRHPRIEGAKPPRSRQGGREASIRCQGRTCGCPGGGSAEVPPTCRCHLPRIVDSPIFVSDRGRSRRTVGVGGLAWSCRPVDEAARATWPGRRLARAKTKAATLINLIIASSRAA